MSRAALFFTLRRIFFIKIFEADFSKITIEGLTELLKVPREMLYDAVALEVQRRKDLTNAMISQMPPTNKCCSSTCCRCCLKNKKCREFHQKMKGEDHYVLQVSIFYS